MIIKIELTEEEIKTVEYYAKQHKMTTVEFMKWAALKKMKEEMCGSR